MNSNIILIITDNIDDIKLLTSSLYEFEVITANNNVTSIEQAKIIQPDLILLSITNNLHKLLKNNIKTKYIPIILLIDHIQDDLKKLLNYGVDYIVKPFTEIGILTRVKLNLQNVKLKKKLKQEITKNKHIEKILLKNEDHFRGYFEAASIGLATTSPKKYWLYANNCTCNMLGYTLAELQNLTWDMLTHPDDLTTDINKFKQLMAGNISSYNIDKRFICKDKTIVYIFLSVTAFYKKDGSIEHIVAILQDITKRKQMEESLRQAKQQAEAANKAKTTFLSNMNHELRTPLNGILGYANILKQDGGLTTLQQNGLDIIHSSGEYLLTLINDILDIAKIEANKMELYLAQFVFYDFLEDIISIIRMRAQQKYIWLALKTEENLPLKIKADETRLRQILLNLLGNAIKFTDNGGAVVMRVRTKQSKLIFEIEDTGIGLTAKQLDKIFQPFKQVGDVKHRTEGTGLGLAISQQLVNLMGGTINVTSKYGEGSTFWFDIPFIEVANNQIEQHVTKEIKANIIPPNQSTLAELHELATLGLIQRLEAQANQLEESDFANHLIELTQKFDDEQLLLFIEKFMVG